MQRNGTRISGFWLAGVLALTLLVTGMGQACWFAQAAWADGAPEVLSTVPANNASGVLVDVEIQVTFSESMNATATQGAFSLEGLGGSFSWDTGNMTMTFDPTASLDGGTAYTANISAAATSMTGDSLATFQWSFTTANVVSVTINDNLPDGLSFGNLDPGSGKQPEDAAPSITITAGSENTADVAIYLKADDFTGPDTIPISNAFYNDANDPDTALAMSNTYSGSPWRTLAKGQTLDIYHWLSIPEGTPAGSYTSDFTYKTDEA